MWVGMCCSGRKKSCKPARKRKKVVNSPQNRFRIMEITGKIIAALPARSGQSARTGNAWMVQEFVIETHDQYPRKCVFNVFGEDKLKEFNIQVGDELTVSFDIDAREYNGRWYNDIRAWRVTRGAAAATAPAPVPEADIPAPTAPAPAADAVDDLPF